VEDDPRTSADELDNRAFWFRRLSEELGGVYDGWEVSFEKT
jgi:hypothetical protein